MYGVTYYDLPVSKRQPAKDFIDEQNDKMQAKIFRNLFVLREKGKELKMPLVCYLDKGIYELRTQLANDITRIFYFFFDDENIILTNGYAKKTQKLDAHEFELAKKYKKEYESRKG